MLTTLSRAEIVNYLSRQLGNLFPDGRAVPSPVLVSRALDRTEACFAPVQLPLYKSAGETYFNHLHSDHYATFLYLVSNEAWLAGELDVAAKVYSLNKAMNGLMCMYDNMLPVHFLLVHTVGMLLGKASYGDYFVAIHDVTVGTDRGLRPTFGTGVVMYGGSAVLGESIIGSYVSVAASATVRNERVPDGHVVAGLSPDLKIRAAKRRLIDEFFAI